MQVGHPFRCVGITADRHDFGNSDFGSGRLLAVVNPPVLVRREAGLPVGLGVFHTATAVDEVDERHTANDVQSDAHGGDAALSRNPYDHSSEHEHYNAVQREEVEHKVTGIGRQSPL